MVISIQETLLCVMLLTAELLKFYGSQHKDYADCHGTCVLYYCCSMFPVLRFEF